MISRFYREWIEKKYISVYNSVDIINEGAAVAIELL